ncbi:TBC domain-containing protein [Apiospora arundinis]
MAPQKYSSVRYKSRPTALVPFRDDTSLIALRYDQTVQAEPPIPIPPPRSPLRNNRSTIAIAGAPVTRPSSTVSSSLSSNNIAAPSVRTPPPAQRHSPCSEGHHDAAHYGIRPATPIRSRGLVQVSHRSRGERGRRSVYLQEVRVNCDPRCAGPLCEQRQR